MVAVRVVALTTVTLEALTVVTGPVTLRVAPVTRPVPVKVTWPDPPWDTAGGLAAVTVGAGLIVRQPVQMPVPTDTLRAPMAAEVVTVALAVMVVALITETVARVTPVPDTVTLFPAVKFVPLITSAILEAPWPR